MISRLRSWLGSPASRRDGTPNLGEAVAAWALGTAWALLCLWLWRIGPEELVPVALLGALLTLWGWRSVRWLHWFPPVAVVASLLDLAAPMPADAAPAGLGYVGMIAFAALLLAFARMLALGRVPIAGRPGEVSATLVGALGLGLALATSGLSARACAAALVAFAAALAMAAHPTGERRVWVAFPLTALLVGAHAMSAVSNGVGELLAQSRTADSVWGAPHALPQLLVLTLPVTLGLALDAGPSLRTISRVALAVGVLGLGIHVWVDRGPTPPVDLAILATRPGTIGISVATLAFLAVVVGRLGLAGGVARPRWIGLAIALLIASVLLVWGRLLIMGTAQVLVAFGVALASAVRTAERRARILGLSPAHWPLAPEPVRTPESFAARAERLEPLAVHSAAAEGVDDLELKSHREAA